jgi:hypothetical protein
VWQLLPKSVATALGHLDQQRQNLQSTKAPRRKKRPSAKEVQEFDEDTNPTKEQPTHEAMANIVELMDVATGKSYSDLTRRFPTLSEMGNLYVLVLYTKDDNAILVEPLKNRSEAEQLKAYTTLLTQVGKGSALSLHWMDNEALAGLKDLLSTKFNLKYQLVPPHIHWCNAAERAIWTFKNHFIAGLCSAADDFLLRLWDKLLLQAELTLNLLRASRVNPTISAYEAINGPFDYNATPLAPPGCKIVVHEKPGQRALWDPHGVIGWYLGPAMEHYRCYRCYIKTTQAEHISDMVEFFPTLAMVPTISPTEALIIAAEELKEALLQPQRTTTKLLVVNITTQLDNIFQVSLQDAPSPRVNMLLPDMQSPRVVTVSGTQPIAQRTRSHVPEEPLFMVNAVIHPITGVAMEYWQLIQDPVTKDAWQRSAANEFGRLAQGVGGRIKGTNTIRFIPHTKLPADRMPTYP